MHIWPRNNNRRIKPRALAQSALVGALYVVLTLCVAPVASGLMQLRLSEALCVLPYVLPAAAPGLFVGCALANLLMGSLPYDTVFGSLATLLAALVTWRMGRRGVNRYLAPLPAVLFNAWIVGWLLHSVYQVGVSFPLCALYVGAGQAIVCYGVGMPLLLLLQRRRFWEHHS